MLAFFCTCKFARSCNTRVPPFFSVHSPIFSQVQYRMHSEIRSFPSARFYEGALADGPGTAMRRSNVMKNAVSSSSTATAVAAAAAVLPAWVSTATISSTMADAAWTVPSLTSTAVPSAPRCFADLPPHPLFPPLLMLDLWNQRCGAHKQSTSIFVPRVLDLPCFLSLHIEAFPFDLCT